MNKKPIGRLLSLAMCVLVAAASCFTAFAEGQTITIEECDNLQITLPDNMTAVTRTSDADDSYYTSHNLSYVDVQQAFLNGDIYMQAMDNDSDVTLTMSCLETDAKDFDTLSNDELNEMSRRFIASINTDVQYESGTADEVGNGTPWIFLDMTVKDPDGNVSRQFQATTVHNGKNITLNLYRNGGDVDGNDYALLESVARTVNIPAKPFYMNRWFWLFSGGTIVAILLIIVIVIIVRSAKRRNKQTKNDKILEELAGKYKTRQGSNVVYDDGEEVVDVSQSGRTPAPAADSQTATPEPAQKPTAQNNAPVSTPDAGKNTQAQNKAAASKPAPEKRKPVKQTDRDIYSGSGDTASTPSASAKTENNNNGFYGADEPKRKYSDEDIERLLGDLDDEEDF